MLSLQEMSDRLEIQDLIARYAHAIDERDYAALDEIFLPESIIDYTEVGGERGTREEIKAYLGKAMAQFPGFQHLSATTKLSINDDRAQARTILFNPMISNGEDGKPHVWFIGLWYADTLIRTPHGWRILERKEHASWHYNAPVGLMP